MSVQSGVTHSSPVSHHAHSYRQANDAPYNSNSRYSELSVSGQQFSAWTNSHHPSSPQAPIITTYNQVISPITHSSRKNKNPLTARRHPSKHFARSKATAISTTEYNLCCRTFLYCTLLILSSTVLVISRKIQNQTLTKHPNNDEYLSFRHQWLQTWFFFVAKVLLMLCICTPCYSRASGISYTYHAQILEQHHTFRHPQHAPQAHSGLLNVSESSSNARYRQSRHKRFRAACMRQLVYCVSAALLVFGEYFLNIALFYLSGSTWTVSLSIILLYVCALQFFRIQASIIVFIGVFCIITGNVMVVSTEMHQLAVVADYNMTTVFFGFGSFCLGLLFMCCYYMLYEHYYGVYREYINALIKFKTLRQSKNERIQDSDYRLLKDMESKMIFYEWNHIRMLYMEGVYGLLITSIIIAVLVAFDVDERVHNKWIHWWFYENLTHFIQCLRYNPVNVAMLIVYVLAVMVNDICREMSISYLTSFHSKLIFVLTVIVVWCMDLSLHKALTPHVDKITDLNGDERVFYGELLTWYSLLEAGAMVFVIFGITLFDYRYVGYVNGMIEHNGLIAKQQKIDELTRYWADVYYQKEKERLCGFSPQHLRADVLLEQKQEEDVFVTPLGRHNSFDLLSENVDESSYNYHELSVNSYRRDGTKLEGTINLLIGDGVSNALVQGPAKYWPALYE